MICIGTPHQEGMIWSVKTYIHMYVLPYKYMYIDISIYLQLKNEKSSKAWIMEWYNGGDIGTEDGARWNTRHVGLVPLWPNGSLFVSYKTDLLVVLAPGAKGRKIELGTKCWQIVEVVLVPILSAMNVLCLHRLWGDSLSEGEAPVCYLSMPLSSSVQRIAELHILCIVYQCTKCISLYCDAWWCILAWL